ncbi:hypothetical protein [Vreelandella gomseomensis]|uniref:Uncharacterized protein n=1 Tax=Vreelandella gomseomensis TaxID=370766 RepID=A0ABU1GF20_9GAMM|nr:hypothetical protein [Halomonas gomseomensis]MDR5876078.1 hypothetical protein [Halomonas gomseomensis]
MQVVQGVLQQDVNVAGAVGNLPQVEQGMKNPILKPYLADVTTDLAILAVGDASDGQEIDDGASPLIEVKRIADVGPKIASGEDASPSGGNYEQGR